MRLAIIATIQKLQTLEQIQIWIDRENGMTLAKILSILVVSRGYPK